MFRIQNNVQSILPEDDGGSQEIPDMATAVRMVENLLRYTFRNKKLLEDALTHQSCTESTSYQRLEFLGDAVLGLAFSNYVFIAYPDIDPGKLSLIRAANISTEKLARVAVRHKLYKYVRHNTIVLDEKVRDFVIAVQLEDEAEVYGGLIKAPKVLADIVESVIAAVYVDCNFDLKFTWMIIRDLLEPIIMLDVLERQPQHVTMLFQSCGKDGKQVDIKHWRNGERNIASVYVDGHFVASASSEQKENAKLHAAKAALRKLSSEPDDMMTTALRKLSSEPDDMMTTALWKLSNEPGEMMTIDLFSQLNEGGEIEGASRKLHELCHKKKWPKPNYKLQEEVVCGGHEKKYICSVEIEISKGVLFVKGNEKSRVKVAKNSAASAMLYGLRGAKHL